MQRIIPPLLLLMAAFLMILIHFVAPYQIIIYPPYNYAGILLIIAGLGIARKCSSDFAAAGTEIHTFKKPRQLVTGGLFKYSRNPIYAGFVMVLAGLNFVLGSLAPFCMILLFIFITDKWYIPYEEKNMQEQFGQDYEDYKRAVRRWL